MTTTSYRNLFTSATAGLWFVAPTPEAEAMMLAGDVLKQYPDLFAADRDEAFKALLQPGTKVDDLGQQPLPVTYEAAAPFELSAAAKAALGDDGVRRLERFRTLRANWDREGARPMNAHSLAALSQFFRDTDLNREGLALYMTQEGNLAVNWVDENDLVTELQFLPDGSKVHLFIERTGDEGVHSSYEVARMLRVGLLAAA